MKWYQSLSPRFRGVMLTLVGGVFWGFGGTCAQYLFEQRGVAPEFLTAARLTIAGIVMVLCSIINLRGKAFSIFKNWRHTVCVIVFGFFGVALCQYTYFRAIAASNAGTACVLQYISPALIIGYACLKARQKPPFLYIVAMILSMVGVFFIAANGDIHNLHFSGEVLFWGLAAAVTVAIYTLMPVPLLPIYGPQVTVGWGMLFGALMMNPMLGWWNVIPQIDVTLILVLATVIVLGTIISFTIYLEGVRLIGSAEAGLYACIEPVIATLCAVLFLGTHFKTTDYIGYALILSVPFIIEYHNSVQNKKKLAASQAASDGGNLQPVVSDELEPQDSSKVADVPKVYTDEALE